MFAGFPRTLASRMHIASPPARLPSNVLPLLDAIVAEVFLPKSYRLVPHSDNAQMTDLTADLVAPAVHTDIRLHGVSTTAISFKVQVFQKWPGFASADPS
ncbi:hypothetical protein NM688_g7938 [Phlebia brevispora]|uniref:Uncharacterized protein n=1 Tax=Phlebia brevispora TaxID=194682 RepID=A0ACC1RZE6_9APHY|nr:hypothetical protein NM688_g7938 [Phlebia brevispora]